MISPSTKLYAVLGHPIRHSFSPAMHNAAFQVLQMDAVYLAFDVAPERLMPTLEMLAELGFNGVNLTVPLKEVAFQNITRLDESARRLGSVNTVKFTPQAMEGFSTDGEGFLRGIQDAFQLSVAGRSVFVLGCGGAGRAVAIASAMAGADRLLLGDLETARARKLEREIVKLTRQVRVQAVTAESSAWVRASREAELVVHATPIGMHRGESSPLRADAFRSGQWVYDLIYMVPETPVMKVARQSGAQAANGLSMLLHQGGLAFAIWTGVEPPVDVMRRALEQGVFGKS